MRTELISRCEQFEELATRSSASLAAIQPRSHVRVREDSRSVQEPLSAALGSRLARTRHSRLHRATSSRRNEQARELARRRSRCPRPSARAAARVLLPCVMPSGPSSRAHAARREFSDAFTPLVSTARHARHPSPASEQQRRDLHAVVAQVSNRRRHARYKGKLPTHQSRVFVSSVEHAFVQCDAQSVRLSGDRQDPERGQARIFWWKQAKHADAGWKPIPIDRALEH